MTTKSPTKVWMYSNGRELVVRQVTEVVLRLEAEDHPLPIINEVLDPDHARALTADLLGTGRYIRSK